jgi:CheY-like chemotaxis protein
MAALNGGRGIGSVAVRGEALSHAGPSSAESGIRRATARPRRVLLVEDEDMVRKVVSRMLMARGFEVQAAASGTEAMALFDAAEPGTFDLLVTDLMMPDGGGLGVARTLTARMPKLKVLLVSGYSPTGTDGWESERFRFLNKPFGSAELARAIDDLFASSTAS